MPELPEVETVRAGLAGVLVGARITGVEARRPDLRFPLPANFSKRLQGQRVVSLERRAKYLVAALSGGEDLIVHLGMTGRLSVRGPGSPAMPVGLLPEARDKSGHDHVLLHLADGHDVIYNDARRFGFMLMMPRHERLLHPMFLHLGVEPLSSELTPEHLAAKARGRKSNLKSLLMDQRVLAGLGNIYVSEVLHRARLSPDRAATSLAGRKGRPTAAAMLLVPAIREVLLAAIAAGGSTLRDYRRADGTVGAFQSAFAVYGRQGAMCPRQGCGGSIRRSVHSGRATFYCPRCQR